MKDFVRHKIIQKCNVSTGLATFPNIKQKHMFSTLMPLDPSIKSLLHMQFMHLYMARYTLFVINSSGEKAQYWKTWFINGIKYILSKMSPYNKYQTKNLTRLQEQCLLL